MKEFDYGIDARTRGHRRDSGTIAGKPDRDDAEVLGALARMGAELPAALAELRTQRSPRYLEAMAALERMLGAQGVRRLAEQIGLLASAPDRDIGAELRRRRVAATGIHPELRGRAERSLGVDLGGVQVFHGPGAAREAARFGAAAFAHGSSIVLGDGVANAPSAVMAEEVAHVAQQRHASAGATSVTAPSAGPEVQARAAAPAILAGRPARVGTVGTRSVMRVERDSVPNDQRNARDLAPQFGSFESRSDDELARIVNDDKGRARYAKRGYLYEPQNPGAVPLDQWLAAWDETQKRARGPRANEEDKGDGQAAHNAQGEPYVADEARPVQRKAMGPVAAGGRGVQRAARSGLSGGGTPLPYLVQLKRSFGRHDLGTVRAYAGPSAVVAARNLGARAYAMGEGVAFAQTPDLHTVAHEAAHVVQQRRGVTVRGGIGAPGDVYEQHADRVADAVVGGRSAESLLDMGPRGGARSAVQLTPEDGGPTGVLQGAERTAAESEGIPADGVENRARLIPTSISGAPRKDEMRSEAFDLRRELLDGRGTRYYFVPADPTHTNETCPGVLLMVEDGVLTDQNALLAVASEIIDAYIRVPGAVRQPPRRGRMTVLLHGRDRPISLHHDNLGIRDGETGIILKRAGAGGARPTYHEFAHAFAGDSPSGSLSEGFASFVQGEFRPGVADRYFPFAQDPHAASLNDTLWTDPDLIARIGGAGDAPNFHTVPGQSEADRQAANARRMWFYRASWSFVDYLIRQVQPAAQGQGAERAPGAPEGQTQAGPADPGRDAFMRVYADPGAYQRVYGRSLPELRSAWRTWVLQSASPPGGGGQPVQRMAQGEASADVHAAAERGTAGGGTALPHGDKIQAAFGGHDLSGVGAHVGGAAAEASTAMGASAFATGDQVAFAQSPDLFTAAHEAAHVVQQRDGVALMGGVGQVGDVYEQHADAVAGAVVRGDSAQDLLDRAPGGGGMGAVQRAVQRTSELTTPNRQTRQDYGVLRGEMENALGRGTNTQQGRQNQQTYDTLFATAAAFSTPLATAIRGIQGQQIPIRGAAGDRQQSLQQYIATVARTSRGLAGQSIADIVQTNLRDRGAAAQQRAQQHIAGGGDVFGAFQGRWRGTWVGRNVQNGQVPASGIDPRNDRTYDHDWQQTAGSQTANDNIRSQPVEMGEYAPGATARAPGQGTQTTSAQAAINTVDTTTGRIVGAVGVSRQGSQGPTQGSAQRPHTGYFIDAHTLLWIAQEGGNLYSCFFEHTTNERPPRYLIMGVQFRWNGTAVTITQLMGTEYNQPPQQRQGPVQRRAKDAPAASPTTQAPVQRKLDPGEDQTE